MPNSLIRHIHGILRANGVGEPTARALARALYVVFRQVRRAMTRTVRRAIPEDVATKKDLQMVIELIDRRFEDMNRRFEDMNRRFEDMNRRFEDMNRRFEDMNRRLEDLYRQIRIMQWLIGLGWMILATLLTVLWALR